MGFFLFFSRIFIVLLKLFNAANMQRNLLESSTQVFYYCKLRVKIALWNRWSSAAVICTLGLKEGWWEQISWGFMGSDSKEQSGISD